MSRKLAVKRLTASDLTFFEWQYKNNPSSKQKAINLNVDVFVEELYPGLRDSSSQARLPVDVFIYGPGLEGEYNLQRKIVKTPGAKNWRLNGEIVANPEDDSQRFNVLSSNDFAIFDFSDTIIPTSVTVVFVAATISEDRSIHQALDQLLGKNGSMIALSPARLEEVVKAASPVPEHPIYGLTLDTDTLSPEVEDIAMGGSRGKTRLASWSSGRKLSRTDLQRAKESADLVGLQGEQFVNDYLQALKEEGQIHEFEWSSNKNAISPYDFWVSYDGTTKTLIDVKSTQGEFERTLHVSLNELLRMREGPERYDIYRVFDIKESTAQLRVVEGVGEWADRVLQVLKDLPQGTTADSVSLSPTIFSFSPAMLLMIGDQTEELSDM